MSVNVKKILLPAATLPACAIERRSYLDSYFDDLLASVESVPNGWEVDLNWPNTSDYYIDPRLDAGLEWWSSGTDVGDIRKQVSHSPMGQISLNDSWTLYSWSHWLRRRRDARELTREVVILHVDDHTDLMTPRLSLSSPQWRDSITGNVFDLFDPESVRSAILSGAVGVGSFMSPFLHSVARVQLRHLSQRATPGTNSEMNIVATTLADIILQPDEFRPSVTVEPSPAGANGHGCPWNCKDVLLHWLLEELVSRRA